jgi:hypothetical protein
MDDDGAAAAAIAAANQNCRASEAFLDTLRRVTTWRLQPEELVVATHKSF